MATDLMLDEDGDIAFDGMEVEVGSGKDVVGQRLYLRLSIVQGEWFADLLFGTPYYENILGGKFNPTILNAVFLNVILSTPGVKKLAAPIQYDLNRRTRYLKMQFTVITVSGESLPVTYPPAA